MDLTKMVADLKQWCIDNYEQGGDRMIECWGTDEYLKILELNDNNYDKALADIKEVAASWVEKRIEQESEIF
jgi:hypothetical protein